MPQDCRRSRRILAPGRERQHRGSKGILLQQLHENGHDLAIADATHALTLDPGLPMAHVNLGHALAGKGDVAGAARSYRRALSMSPDRVVEEEALEALEKLGVRPDDEDEDEDEDAR